MRLRIEAGRLSSYLDQLGKAPMLTRDAEHDLAVRARAGDEKAREALIESHLPMVVAVAKQYARHSARIEDLIQEGNLGLIRAAEDFDPARGNRFGTYASWWVRAYIARHARVSRSQVRGGDQDRRSFADVSLNEAASPDRETLPLDQLVGSDPGPEGEVLRAELSHEVRAALLAARKRIGGLGWDVLEQRTMNDDPQSLDQIGRRWGVSHETVRQSEKKTHIFLRRYLEALAT